MTIKVKNVSKTYRQGEKIVHALNNVSLQIEKKDVYGIIGLSGAGKSTLIRALAGLVTPSSGSILFHGNDIAHMNKYGLRTFRKKIGMIFQHFNLLSSRTVAGNIAYPLELAQMSLPQQDLRIDELLELVGLKDKKDAYSSQLSGGEKQRVGIARALATNPEVLFCDEATSALDPRTTKEILALLKTINKTLGVTVVLITHEMDVIKQICNKVAVIEQGGIVEEGPVSQVFADPQHAITKSFLQNTSHEIPRHLFKKASDNRKLLRLTFKGKSANEPIMSEIIRKFNLDINILQGWIDNLQDVLIGTLTLEVIGEPQNIAAALSYLEQKSTHYEVIENEF